MSRLEVEVRHRFPSGFALDVEFVAEHPVTALFGPSGAGKTSVLMCIAGLLHPNDGRVAWRDRLLFDSRAGTMVPAEQRRIGVVFQDQRLFPHLNGEQNLRYGERRRGSGAQTVSLDRTIEVLELGELLPRSPRSLSGGEQQRLALGRALLSGPELLLLDEPVAAVDEPRRNIILRYVDRISREWGIPTVYVSHHRAEVQRLADRVVALADGRVVEEGPPERVLGAAGSPRIAGEPINLLRLERPERIGDDAWQASVPGAEVAIRLPSLETQPPELTFVQFAASDVVIARGEVAQLSARNRIPATVRELVPRQGWIFVSVEVADQTIWAEVTAEAVEDLGLQPGEPVTCLVKVAALEVLL